MKTGQIFWKSFYKMNPRIESLRIGLTNPDLGIFEVGFVNHKMKWTFLESGFMIMIQNKSTFLQISYTIPASLKNIQKVNTPLIFVQHLILLWTLFAKVGKIDLLSALPVSLDKIMMTETTNISQIEILSIDWISAKNPEKDKLNSNLVISASTNITELNHTVLNSCLTLKSIIL